MESHECGRVRILSCLLIFCCDFGGNLLSFTFKDLVGRLHKVTSGVRKKGVNTTLKQKELPYGLLNP